MINISCEACGGVLQMIVTQLSSDIDIKVMPCGCRDFRHLNDAIETATAEIDELQGKLDKVLSVISGT